MNGEVLFFVEFIQIKLLDSAYGPTRMEREICTLPPGILIPENEINAGVTWPAVKQSLAFVSIRCLIPVQKRTDLEKVA